jgi:Pup amidohydrolase
LATPKYVGTETEFGITVTGPTEVNPVLASSMVVGAYRVPDDISWDHTDEHPLRDARGYEVPDAHEPPTDDELGLANTVLTNGARFYVDHAHPEYSSPECSNARDLVIWDKAGERILEDAARRAEVTLPEGSRVLIHKNNTDGKGAAYGTHENYLVPRDVPFGKLTRQLLPFFVSRPIYTGAGRLGSELDEDVAFQLTQRADFFEVDIGLETTLKRPLMNTRDEPHADPERYRRLHVINGDANLCEVATFAKVGTMLVVLDLIEDDALGEVPVLARPVEAFHTVSHDLDCSVPLLLEDGRTDDRAGDPGLLPRGGQALPQGPRPRSGDRRRAGPLGGPADHRRGRPPRAGRPGRLGDQARPARSLPRAPRPRLGPRPPQDGRPAVPRRAPRQGALPAAGLTGRVERLVAESEITHAIDHPPEDTRAWFRGECLRRFRTRSSRRAGTR